MKLLEWLFNTACIIALFVAGVLIGWILRSLKLKNNGGK